jgi:hypothetical protein
MKNDYLWAGQEGVRAARRVERTLLISGWTLVAGGTGSAALVLLQADQAALLAWAALPLLGFALAGTLLVASALLVRETVKARRRTPIPEAAVFEEEFARAA